jgi:mono/diheme cytochrome c family protein
MKKMKRTLTVFLGLGMASMAITLGSFNGVFHETYDISKTSALGQANCLACHEKKTGGKLTGYGFDLQKEMKASKAKKLTPAVLKAVEKLDSNKNGKSNLEDIKAGHIP